MVVVRVVIAVLLLGLGGAGCATQVATPAATVVTVDPLDDAISRLRQAAAELDALDVRIELLLQNIAALSERRTAAVVTADVARVIQKEVMGFVVGQGLGTLHDHVVANFAPELLPVLAQAGLVDTVVSIITSLIVIRNELALAALKLDQAKILDRYATLLVTELLPIRATAQIDALEAAADSEDVQRRVQRLDVRRQQVKHEIDNLTDQTARFEEAAHGKSPNYGI